MMRYSMVFFLFFALLASDVMAQSAEDILSTFDGEPTVREVQEVAAEYAQINESAMEGWRRRASTSALLPDVRVEYRFQMEDDRTDENDQDFEVDANGDLILTGLDLDVRLDDDEYNQISLQGDWNFQELIWNADLLRISKETRDTVELREDILTTVTSLYFERRRAQVQLLVDPPSDAMERMRRELEIEELTAQIDAFTGGWFSEVLSAAGIQSY